MSSDVCALDDMASGSVHKVVVDGHEIALVRIDDMVYAIGDKCSHADVSLSEGEVSCDTKELECPRHGSSFSLETGVPSTLPATQPVPVYVAHVKSGRVIVEVSK